MEDIEVRALTAEALKEWLLEQRMPQDLVDVLHAEDIDGDTLTELMEERNAVDFKQLCPAIKHRVKLRNLLSTTGSYEAVNVKFPPQDIPQQALLTTEETSTKSFKVKSESSGKVKEELQTGQSQSTIIHLDDADEPIPHPFKFPKFPRALQEGLEKDGLVSTKVIRDAAKYTAHALYSYSRHVSKDDRERVADELVQKYPKLKSDNKARPYDQIAQDIRAHFKELNRKRPALFLEPYPKAKKEERAQTPQIKREPDEAEDEESYQQHVTTLISEYSKAKKDKRLVGELMKITFKRRRQEVEGEPQHVDEILKRHPFLQDFNEFSAEVERLFGMGLDLKFLEVVPIVIKHGRNAEARTAVQDVAKQWDNELEGFDAILALRYLAAMLGNKKAKVDPDTLVREIPDNTTAEELAEEQKCPSILYNRHQTFLAMDCRVLFIFPKEKAAVVLLGSYYVFHVSYPKQHTGLFTYLERVHGLKETVKEVPRTVKTLETALRSAH